MNLTKDQEEAIQAGHPIEMELAGTLCVILPKDAFDEMMKDDYLIRGTYAAVLKAIDEDDEDPDQYLEYLGKP